MPKCFKCHLPVLPITVRYRICFLCYMKKRTTLDFLYGAFAGLMLVFVTGLYIFLIGSF